MSGAAVERRLAFRILSVAIFGAVFAKTFVLQGVAIPGRSMVPTLLPGDHVLVDKLTLSLPASVLLPSRRPQRGDLVVVRSPASPESLLVKRLIGLPGETLEISGGSVSVDGRRLDESGWLPRAERTLPGRPPQRLAADAFFVLGDARSDSLDSRDFGALPAGALLGRVVLLYWSWEDPAAGTLPEPSRRKTRWRRVLRRIGGG